MRLVTLPNGDAVRPDAVKSVQYLEASPVEMIGSIKTGGHPHRVVVHLDNGGAILCYRGDAEQARMTRDGIIDEINESLREARQ